MWEGTCEKFASVDCRSMTEWILTIPLEEWPQGHRPGSNKPSMMCRLDWNDFGTQSDQLAYDILWALRKVAPSVTRCENRMLSCVMPGEGIYPHQDRFDNYWFCRVHVPLVAFPGAVFKIEDTEYVMKEGRAYLVNISKTHSAFNHGAVPRIHFMMDCYAKCS